MNEAYATKLTHIWLKEIIFLSFNFAEKNFTSYFWSEIDLQYCNFWLEINFGYTVYTSTEQVYFAAALFEKFSVSRREATKSWMRDRLWDPLKGERQVLKMALKNTLFLAFLA